MKKLLIFKGGGYDGCFWEWNALVFDEDGKLSDESLVSGRSGKEAYALVEESGVFRGVRSLIREGFNSRQANTNPFLVRTDAQWEYFCKEWNSGFVRSVARVADQRCRCDRCGRFFDCDEIVHTGYKGNGGVGIQYTDNKCCDCAEIEHDEFVANDWRHLRLAERIKAIQRARQDGCDVSILAARRDIFPAIYGRHVYEPEFY